jgi:uncharacterized membrane protein
METSIVVRIVVVVFVVLIVDGIWLRLQRQMYRETIRKTQKKELSMRFSGAALSYVCIIFLIVFLSETIETSSIWQSALYGFLLGLATYGVFNGTNVAIFKDYSTKTAVVDSMWGGTLFALTFAIYKWMM